MNGDAKGGLSFSARYILTIILMFIAMILTVYILAWDTFGNNNTVTLLSLIIAVLPATVPFALLTVIAFMAGYCPEGTKDRFFIRLLMDAFKIFCIFYVSHSVSYIIDKVVLDPSIGGYMRDLDLNLNVTVVAIILTILPVLSIIDNFLEYKQNKDSIMS